jgi:hypothetical protein
MQTTARRNEWALDRTMNTTEMTRFIEPASVTAHNKEVSSYNIIICNL